MSQQFLNVNNIPIGIDTRTKVTLAMYMPFILHRYIIYYVYHMLCDTNFIEFREFNTFSE